MEYLISLNKHILGSHDKLKITIILSLRSIEMFESFFLMQKACFILMDLVL